VEVCIQYAFLSESWKLVLCFEIANFYVYSVILFIYLFIIGFV